MHGHFKSLPESGLPPWQDMVATCSEKMAPIVGARPAEIVMMNTLTVNLHLLMASFYKPTKQRHKIIVEWKPFPSDYYAVDSHLQWHGRDPRESMVEIWPDDHDKGGHIISTGHILAKIDEHAETTALLMLPGLQYYSGQVFDMERITKYAQERGIVVGWDLAHAAGNIPLYLHDWNVDFAAWCTYKYLNAGPGSMAGAFVHERHGGVAAGEDGSLQFRHRLSGWYGVEKSVRFNMAKTFQPTPGAQGFQLSNPSAIDLASLHAALSEYGKTSVEELRRKSLVLTAYAEWLLDNLRDQEKSAEDQTPALTIITPRGKRDRGAQLSVLLRDGLLESVSEYFAQNGVVCDQRKPGVIRVAPVPMYNRFEDVWKCVDTLRRAILS